MYYIKFIASAFLLSSASSYVNNQQVLFQVEEVLLSETLPVESTPHELPDGFVVIPNEDLPESLQVKKIPDGYVVIPDSDLPERLRKNAISRRPRPYYPHQKPVRTDFVEGKRLIQMNDDETEAEWMGEEEVLELIRTHVGFMDITDNDIAPLSMRHASTARNAIPKKAAHTATVMPLLEKISLERMKSTLKEFTSFETRYYKSESGRKSSEWLFDQVSNVGMNGGKQVQGYYADSVVVEVESYPHEWGQRSVIARITPKNVGSGAQSGGRIVIGSHQDSLNQWNPMSRSPGADDDGSGTTTILEAFRILIESGYVPSRTLEFHWYSAEEGGLLGSQKIAKQYHEHGVEVAAMIQVDMTGYVSPNSEEVIAIAQDYSSRHVTKLLENLTEAYCAIPYKPTRCGYGCSDHASWNKAGVKAGFIIESDMDENSPFIHSAKDDINTISFTHMREFVKLVLGFAVETTSV